MVEKGMVYGRFQIMHMKHLEYILAAKMRCQKLYIGITVPDAQYAPTDAGSNYRARKSANPMTYIERYEMIEGCMRDFKVDRNEYEIVPFPIDRPAYIDQYIPKDAVIFMSICDEWTQKNEKLFEYWGLNTEILWRKDPQDKGISGTEIRQRILAGEKWNDLVPRTVYNYVINHGIDNRIRFTK